MNKMLRSGAHQAVVDEICRCYEEGLTIDQTDVRIQAMGANQWDDAALDVYKRQRHTPCGRSTRRIRTSARVRSG